MVNADTIEQRTDINIIKTIKAIRWRIEQKLDNDNIMTNLVVSLALLEQEAQRRGLVV